MVNIPSLQGHDFQYSGSTAVVVDTSNTHETYVGTLFGLHFIQGLSSLVLGVLLMPQMPTSRSTKAGGPRQSPANP